MIHAGIFQFVAVSLVEFGAVKLQTLQEMKIILKAFDLYHTTFS
jgi:hypothetical protein